MQPDRVLSTMRMPSTDVLFQALNLYQTDFKKPSLSIYCLDYSGSMSGKGNEQLVAAMEQLLIQENAEKNFLQASKDEVNVLIFFDDQVLEMCIRDRGIGADDCCETNMIKSQSGNFSLAHLMQKILCMCDVDSILKQHPAVSFACLLYTSRCV